MTLVVGDISISLDGFVAGPDDGPEQGLGRGGEPIHGWVGSDDPVDQRAMDETAGAGAVVMGRRLFDVVDGPHGWTEERGYGYDRDVRPSLVVLTSTAVAEPRLAALYDVTFATAGPHEAVERARAAARGGDVHVMGGGRTVRACLDAGLLDRLRLHVSTLVLGGGAPLFGPGTPRGLTLRATAVSSTTIHATYDASATPGE